MTFSGEMYSFKASETKGGWWAKMFGLTGFSILVASDERFLKWFLHLSPWCSSCTLAFLWWFLTFETKLCKISNRMFGCKCQCKQLSRVLWIHSLLIWNVLIIWEHTVFPLIANVFRSGNSVQLTFNSECEDVSPLPLILPHPQWFSSVWGLCHAHT